MEGPLTILISGLTAVFVAIAFEAYALSAAVGLVQLWLRLYTYKLPDERAARRHAEIKADIEAHKALAVSDGTPPRAVALQIFMRLIMGLPADVAWRLNSTQRQRRRP